MYKITLLYCDWKAILKGVNKAGIDDKFLYVHIRYTMERLSVGVQSKEHIPVTINLIDSNVELLLDDIEKADRYSVSNDITLLLLHGQITWQVVEQDRIREQFGYSDISEIEEDCKDD